MNLSNARKAFKAGSVVTVVFGKRSAQDWRYGTLMGATLCAAPGYNVWQNVTSEVLAADVGLRDALAVLSGGPAPKGTRYMGAESCLDCGRALTTPESVLAGRGPECSGVYADQKARTAARNARWSTPLDVLARDAR